jgi:hypothetical protein
MGTYNGYTVLANLHVIPHTVSDLCIDKRVLTRDISWVFIGHMYLLRQLTASPLRSDAYSAPARKSLSNMLSKFPTVGHRSVI